MMDLTQPDPDQTLRVSTQINFETTDPLHPIVEVIDEVLTAYGVLATSPNNASEPCLRVDSGSYRIHKQPDLDDLYNRLCQASGVLDGEEIAFDGVEFHPNPEKSETQPTSVYVPVESGLDKLHTFRQKELDIFHSVDAYIPSEVETPRLMLAYTANGIPTSAVTEIKDRLEDVETEFRLTIDTDDFVSVTDLSS